MDNDKYLEYMYLYFNVPTLVFAVSQLDRETDSVYVVNLEPLPCCGPKSNSSLFYI